MDVILKINQIIVVLSPKTPDFTFDFEGFKAVGYSYNPPYVDRKYPNVTARISRNLKIHLFIYGNLEYYLSEVGFHCLYQHLMKELRRFVKSRVAIYFNFRITNIQANFPTTRPEFTFFKKIHTITRVINTFYQGQGGKVPRIYQNQENGQTGVLVNFDCGSIKVYPNTCTLIVNSVFNLISLKKTILDLAELASNNQSAWRY